jgi:hypothetical protein
MPAASTVKFRLTPEDQDIISQIARLLEQFPDVPIPAAGNHRRRRDTSTVNAADAVRASTRHMLAYLRRRAAKSNS